MTSEYERAVNDYGQAFGNLLVDAGVTTREELQELAVAQDWRTAGATLKKHLDKKVAAAAPKPPHAEIHEKYDKMTPQQVQELMSTPEGRKQVDADMKKLAQK